MTDVQIGERYELTHDVDRYPHFIASKGMQGTVVDLGLGGEISLKLDEHLPGAEEWDNSVVFTVEDDRSGLRSAGAALLDAARRLRATTP